MSIHGNDDSDLPDRQSGLTLVELVVVLAILAIITALASPAMTSFLPGYQLRAVAGEIVAEIRVAKALALSKNRPVGFFMDIGMLEFHVGGRPAKTWSDTISAQFTSAKVLQIDDTTGEIRFYPDGSSTGGRLILKGGDRTITLNVDWFNGQVTRDENKRE